MNNGLTSDVDRKRLWLSWTVSCATGELIGISLAAGFAMVVNQVVGDPHFLSERLLVLGVMILAGILEGVAIGFFQWRILQRVFKVSLKSWLAPTVSVAAIGWFLGMLQPTFFSGDVANSPGASAAEPSTLIVMLFAATFGLIAGAVFGFAQWLVLRKHTSRAWIWIPANAIGWAAALAIIYLGAGIPDETWSIGKILPLGAMTGIVAGLAIGAFSGLGLVKIQHNA